MKIKAIKIVSIILLLFSLSGCKSSKYNIESDINKGYVVSSISNNYNTEKLDEFLERLKLGQNSELIIVQVTKEGDPIYFSLSYEGDKIAYKRDNSMDRYGEKNIIEDRINKDDFYKKGNKYYVTLDNEEILLFDLEVIK